jgi:hypothetical protein
MRAAGNLTPRTTRDAIASIEVHDIGGHPLIVVDLMTYAAAVVEWEATKARINSNTDPAAYAVRRWSDPRIPDDTWPGGPR